jgi:hypothetical protein
MDLLRRGRADVVRPDHGAEAFGRRDRLESCDACAQDDDLGCLHGAGGGHVEGEEATQHAGGHDRAAVARDQRLGAEPVHGLGPGDARDELDRVGGHAGVAQLDDRLVLLVDREERDGGRAAGEPADLRLRQRLDRDHHVGTVERLAVDRGAGLGVLLVGHQRVRPRAGLDRDGVPQRGELADQLRHHRHPELAVPSLLGHCDLHADEPRALHPARPHIPRPPRVVLSTGSGDSP